MKGWPASGWNCWRARRWTRFLRGTGSWGRKRHSLHRVCARRDSLRGNGAPQAAEQDVNKDGRLDLVVHVNTEALQLTNVDTMAEVKGETYSGQAIQGSDSVRIVQ